MLAGELGLFRKPQSDSSGKSLGKFNQYLSVLTNVDRAADNCEPLCLAPIQTRKMAFVPI